MPERFYLTLPVNFSFRDLTPAEKTVMERRLAWNFDCRKVTVHSDPLHARRGWIDVYRDPEPPRPDYTEALGPWPGWPGADDFSKPIPLGIAAKTGEPVGLRLFSAGMKNILIFGVPGSGKSVGAAEIIATAAQDPTVDLWGMDGGGGTDLEFWRPRMSHYEVKVEAAFLMIQELKAEIERRSEAMVAAKRRVIEASDPKILLLCEEFATFTDEKRKRCLATGQVRTGKEDDPSEAFIDALAYVGRLGRKYGVGIVLITQRPTVDAIPGKLRGLVQYAWGFRCRDAQGWKAGFGPGVPFVRLDKSRPGTSMLLAENDDPLLMRSYFISDKELEEIASVTALSPGISPVSPSDTNSQELCLENSENVVSLPVEHVSQPVSQPVSLTLDNWDRAVLAFAIFPKTSKEIVVNASVYGKAPSTAYRRLKALTMAGYLSASPRPSVTAPQTYLTTLEGRQRITAAEVGNIPDGDGEPQASDSGVSTTEGGAQ